jgi:hypothetical protein
MKKLIALFALIPILFLAGCAGISAGTVSSKQFVPEHKERYSTCVRVGKVPVCTPHTRTVSDKYYLHLQDGDQTGKVSVSSDTYEMYEVGDWYDADAR